MVAYLADMEGMYGTHETRRLAALPEAAVDDIAHVTLPELAAFVNASIVAGKV